MNMVRLVCGDALEQLRLLPDESVQCCITSPPYWGLRDYGIAGQLGLERTPEEYVAKLVKVFREVRRVLRDDGTFWLNLGDCYHSGDCGGYRKDSHRWENSHMQAMAHGTHMEAVSPNRLPQAGLKDKDLVGIPWRVAFALQADGWWLRSDIIWSKPNPMPESVTDRPTKAHEYLFLLTKSARYYYDAEAIREPDTESLHDRTRKARATDDQKCAPTETVNGIRPAQKLDEDPDRRRRGFNDRWDAAERDSLRRSKMPDGWDTKMGAHATIHREGRERGAASAIRPGRNRRTVWTIPTQPFPEAHFATFPEALVEPCIAAGSRPAGRRCDCDELIASPLGSGPNEDPSMETGRAGMNRPRRVNEGTRPVTRRQQSEWARQIINSPHHSEMEREAGVEAFAHYVRTDRSGARPPRPDLLELWLSRGWLGPTSPCDCPVQLADLVLDPFAGSGTVGVVALRSGRDCILIDLNQDYVEMARRRIEGTAPLFAEVKT